jgi:hypothetical protein
MVEIKSIAGRSCGVMVLEGLERGGSIVLWIAGTKKAAELFQKFREGVKPQRKATAMSYSMIQLGLEPIERHIAQIRENERNSFIIIGKIVGASGEVHGALENECIEFLRVSAVENVRDTWSGCAFSFRSSGKSGDCGRQQRNRFRQGKVELRCRSIGELIRMIGVVRLADSDVGGQA